MELSNIFVLIFLFFLCLGFLGWILLGRLQSLFQERRDDPSLLLVQQQIGDLRVQLGQVLEQSAQSIQQQLGQVLGNVNERLKENAEVLHKTQQNMGERLDNAAVHHRCRPISPLQLESRKHPPRRLGYCNHQKWLDRQRDGPRVAEALQSTQSKDQVVPSAS